MSTNETLTQDAPKVRKLRTDIPVDTSGRDITKEWSYALHGLRYWRMKKRLSMRRLGEISGVAYSAICQLENLQQKAYKQTVEKLASALGVAHWDMLTKDPEAYKAAENDTQSLTG